MVGTFADSPAAGAVPGAGTHTLSVAFTPTHAADDKAVTATIFVLASAGATRTFLKQVATTQGAWIGTHGSQGHEVINGSSSLPSYTTATPAWQSNLFLFIISIVCLLPATGAAIVWRAHT